MLQTMCKDFNLHLTVQNRKTKQRPSNSKRVRADYLAIAEA